MPARSQLRQDSVQASTGTNKSHYDTLLVSLIVSFSLIRRESSRSILSEVNFWKVNYPAHTKSTNAVDRFEIMTPRTVLFFIVVLVAFASLCTPLPTGDKERFINELDLVDDDGSIETALINYLFTKQVVKRLRNQMDIGDLQRKRSYWKQCAFNAVSCFGK